MAGIQNSLTALITTLGTGIWANKGFKQRELQELAQLKGEEIPKVQGEVAAAEEGVKEASLTEEAVSKGYDPDSLALDTVHGTYTGTKYLTPDTTTIDTNVHKAQEALVRAQGVLEGKQAQLKLFEKRRDQLAQKWRVK